MDTTRFRGTFQGYYRSPFASSINLSQDSSIADAGWGIHPVWQNRLRDFALSVQTACAISLA
jgi:hypothetical protein